MPSYKDLHAGRKEEFPPEGWVGPVICIGARVSETAKKYPAFGMQLQVTSGPDIEEQFWDNTYLSANGRWNDQQFTKLEAAGIEPSFWDSDPSDAEVEKKMTGLKVNVRASWDPNESDPSSPWLRCTYIPNGNGNAATSEDFSDDETSEPDGFED